MIKKIILNNRYLLKLTLFFLQLKLQRTKHINFGNNIFITVSNFYEGHHSFGHDSSISNSYIGFGSYTGSKCLIKNTKIGRYTSIGSNVVCIFGKHPSSTFVSTHPAFFSLREQAGFTYVQTQLFDEFEKPVNKDSTHSIYIGNDVWIGTNVSLMDGVRIGDGAVIAANALVNKDVPPFCIVGGVPAKIIKKRFADDKIDFLLRLKWWEKKESWIKDNADKFTNIENFYKIFKNEQ